MVSKKNFAFISAILVSASFAGYNIGSGFASGVEGQQFFASFGFPYGFIGLIIAGVLMSIMFIPVYLVGFNKKYDKQYNVYHYYCGEKIGTLIDIYIFFSILLIILVMMSGAGTTINQYFGIPNAVGTILLGILCIIAELLGLKKLMRILSYAGIFIIVFVVICTAYIKFGLGVNISMTAEEIQSHVTSGDLIRISIFGFSNPILCGIANAGLLIVSSLPWVATTGALCEDKKTAMLSGSFSGLFFYVAQAVVVFLNLMCMSSIIGKEVPVLAVFQTYIPKFAMLYAVIILIANFSTISGRLYLFATRFDRGSRKLHILITVVLVILSAFAGTFISFTAVSNFMFTINSYLGIFIIFAITMKTIKDYTKKNSGVRKNK